MSIEQEFRENFKRERIARGTSQTAVSLRTGIAQPAITKIESGAQRIKLDDAYLLANALGVSLVDLLPKAAHEVDEELQAVAVERLMAREVQKREARIRALERKLAELRAES